DRFPAQCAYNSFCNHFRSFEITDPCIRSDVYSMTSRTLCVNVGILGHVDSGKTSLAKKLSSTASTACFDKNPQSQQRGITIDLGFSSFQLDCPDRLN